MNQRALLPEILSITSARAPATGAHEAALRERQEVAVIVSSRTAAVQKPDFHVGWAAVSFLAPPRIHAFGHFLPLAKGGFVDSRRGRPR